MWGTFGTHNGTVYPYLWGPLKANSHNVLNILYRYVSWVCSSHYLRPFHWWVYSPCITGWHRKGN